MRIARLLMVPALLASLAALLAACSATIQIPLPEQSISAATMMDTLGKILYPKDSIRGFQPVPGVKEVRVEGTLEANQPLDTTLSFYVRLSDPRLDSSCSYIPVLQAYACPIGPADENTGEAQFQSSYSTFLALKGANLTQGIAQGQFWLGLEAQGLPSRMVTFTLKNAKATVTVGF